MATIVAIDTLCLNPITETKNGIPSERLNNETLVCKNLLDTNKANKNANVDDVKVENANQNFEPIFLISTNTLINAYHIPR